MDSRDERPEEMKCSMCVRHSLPKTAVYNEGDLQFLMSGNSTFLSLCSCSNLTRSIPAFAQHRLPDGTLLNLCYEPVDSFCESFTSLESSNYLGPEFLKLERTLIGSGAHRALETSITVKHERCKECHVMIIERLPSGVFADLFELEGLVARAVYDDVAIYGDHNLELPALNSYESVVVLYTRFNFNSENLLHTQVSLPLHARYPPLNLEGYAVVDLSFPYILVQCIRTENSLDSFSETLGSSKKDMAWALLTTKSRIIPASELQWLVPAGNFKYTNVVATITASVSLIAVVVLWVISTNSFHSHKSKKI
ncbi:hypothetical protein KP509_35G021600 [Ceratopteris richardii]|uniref:Phosphatidylinositol-glycan biosynthesis class X protein n=1 Tax=Ceratopteris richardii TaxID=49495 RepID=A0A8T2QF61_CERRI|nr:hypothetical protein KP509_35G021600 [Ceratopteris richardii]